MRVPALQPKAPTRNANAIKYIAPIARTPPRDGLFPEQSSTPVQRTTKRIREEDADAYAQQGAEDERGEQSMRTPCSVHVAQRHASKGGRISRLEFDQRQPVVFTSLADVLALDSPSSDGEDGR